MDITASQSKNQPGSAGGRPPHADPPAVIGPITDRQFRDETPDEAAAERWFTYAFWQKDGLPRCPR